jgi:hypothetical protein
MIIEGWLDRSGPTKRPSSRAGWRDERVRPQPASWPSGAPPWPSPQALSSQWRLPKNEESTPQLMEVNVPDSLVARVNQGFSILGHRSVEAKGGAMLNRIAMLVLGSVFVASAALAQGSLLLDPAQAPVTLKGGWEMKQGPAGGGGNRGEIVVKISKINPDGTFEGKFSFSSTGSTPWCRAVDEPIQQGKITANGIALVANGGPPTTCGLMTLNFRRGSEKWLVGRLKSEAGGGTPMWLDAPK